MADRTTYQSLLPPSVLVPDQTPLDRLDLTEPELSGQNIQLITEMLTSDPNWVDGSDLNYKTFIDKENKRHRSADHLLQMINYFY